jgi:N-acetylglucosamine transport system substrate-binding protein
MTEIPAPKPEGMDRRQLLTRIGMSALLAGPGVSLLSACATSGSSNSDNNKVNDKDAKNPFGVKANDALDVVIFMGGYKDQYATQGHEPLYKTVFPKAKIKHEAVTAIGQTLKPRFNSGTNIPDVVDNSGTDLMDFGALAQAGQLHDLTQFWAAPSVDNPGTALKDTVIQGTVVSGEVNGKPYYLNYVATTFGIWYNAALFQEKGWQVPKTWNDLVTLCDKIKAAGITPIGYAGKNAAYYLWFAMLQSAAKLGGNQVVIDIDNLKAGAWSVPAVNKAAAAWGDLFHKYSDPAYQGLIHTQVQTLHKQNKVALYPCGNWLENEMKDVAGAPGFQYAVMPMPDMGGEQLAYPALRNSPGEGFFVSAKGKNVAGGLEYLRLMLSKKGAQAFYKYSGNITVLKDPTILDGLQLTPGTQSVIAAQKAAGTNLITYQMFDQWYKDLDMECRNQSNKLCFGGGTASAFCSAMDSAANKIRNDSTVTKQTRTA